MRESKLEKTNINKQKKKGNAMSTKNKTVGRKRLEVSIPRGKFTITKLAELNPNVIRASLVNHVKYALDSKIIVELKEMVKGDGPGRPSHVYCRKSAIEAAKNLKKTAPVATPDVTVASPATA